MMMKTLEQIYNDKRNDYDIICNCDVQCEQHLDIERNFMNVKIRECVEFYLNSVMIESSSIVDELMFLIDDMLIHHCDEVISDNKEHEYESELN